MAIPAMAAAAYQAAANIGQASAGTASAGAAAAGAGAGDFSGFLESAIKDGIGTMKQGEAMASNQVAGKANIVDVVSAVNQAEITLDTVVAVRDKVVQAYQSIMNMPI
ncbi:MAG TPA: flagellar hook-basal body complex protein FliE [Rhizomicrobium sp.]|jgi:flagellar hook-basal body complex protein FliE|nr:flagellar hook-basal body complex protein FliE [Rhizomicrobium sp.]